MAYITLANTKRIIFKSNINGLNLEGEVYQIPIYFFSKYEKNALLAIKELLKTPEKFFTEIYQPYEAIDTYSYVYEGQQPAYHKFSCCPRLQSNYENFEIPSEIKEKGPHTVKDFRGWFEGVKYLLQQPDIFAARLKARWGIVTNPKSINRYNSGSTTIENPTIEKLHERIDELIKEAEHYFYKSEKHKEILKRFSQLTFLAYKKGDIYKNDTDYSDEEVKQLLKDFDEKYKQPLKNYLIEYYRLKLNPKVKMRGYILEKLGFKPCGNCHSDEYEPDQKDDELKFTFEFMLKNKHFFLTILSMYYSFTEQQLIKYKETLIFGSPQESFEDYSIPQTLYAQYGLNFNNNIKWTNSVREAYWVEPYLIHAFGSENLYYSRDFENLPLSQKVELDFFRNFSKNWASYYSEDHDEIMECIKSDERYTNELEMALSQNEFHDWKTIMKIFEEDNRFELVKLIFNENFYKEMMVKVKIDNPKFDIDLFIKNAGE